MLTHRKRTRSCVRTVLAAGLTSALVVGTSPQAWALAPDEPRAGATFNDVVRTVVRAGDTLYVGGLFTSATDSTGTHVRNHVAAVDASTGQLLDWNPNANRPVWSIVVSGDAVYLGGDFSQVDGRTRRRLAKVSAGTGAVAGDFVHTASRQVTAMTVSGGSLYVGGKFDAIDGSSRARLAAFDLGTGALRADWRPTANANVLTLDSDSQRIYVGGRFTSLNSRSSAGFLAAVDPADGDLDTTFGPSISYPVSDLELASAAVYAAADGPGGHLRAFAPTDGDDLWDLPTDGGVQAVTEIAGTIYFGGHFDRACREARSTPGSCRAGDTSRRKLAAADASGDLLSWAPQANSSLGVVAMASGGTEQVAVGGAFTHFRSGAFVRPHFALFGE
jgi:hypothetical protein